MPFALDLLITQDMSGFWSRLCYVVGAKHLRTTNGYLSVLRSRSKSI